MRSADHVWTDDLRRLGRLPLLVVDEVGYIPFDPEAAKLMFMLVSSRYERASLIATSNKPFSAWGEVFGDEIVAAAMIESARPPRRDRQPQRRQPQDEGQGPQRRPKPLSRQRCFGGRVTFQPLEVGDFSTVDDTPFLTSSRAQRSTWVSDKPLDIGLLNIMGHGSST